MTRYSLPCREYSVLIGMYWSGDLTVTVLIIVSILQPWVRASVAVMGHYVLPKIGEEQPIAVKLSFGRHSESLIGGLRTCSKVRIVGARGTGEVCKIS